MAEEFEYDNIGLPTKYRNQPMAWNNRNLLADYKNVLFTYDGTGMRLAKSTYVEIIDDDGTQRREITGTTTFDYEGDRLLSESRNGTPIRYVYGASGVIGFKYNGANYYYVRNLQGDVTRIVDTNNQIVAQYTYDAWGNCTIVSETNNIGSLNAIRYRGYYFDSETGLYYLQTRYYDPEIGRFISPDSTKYLDPETLGGLNLYAYCNNNPVMYIDESGQSPEWWQWALFAVGIALVAVATGMVIIGTGGVFAFGVGALIGSLSVGATGAVIGGAVGYATGGVDGIIGGALAGFGIGATVGFIVGGTIGYSNTKVHSVYIFKSNDVVNYVGRTNNISRRTAEHALSNRGIVPQEVAKKLTLKQSRGLEQALINKYGLKKAGGSLINKINSIATTNPIYDKAVAWGAKYISKILHLL